MHGRLRPNSSGDSPGIIGDDVAFLQYALVVSPHGVTSAAIPEANPRKIQMIVVIFESWPAPGKMQTYLDMGQSLGPHVEKLEGFISVERFQSVMDPTKLVALSFWRDMAAVDNFRNLTIHRAVQSGSRRDVFLDYRLRVAEVIRDYTLADRDQAPEDSQATHK